MRVLGCWSLTLRRPGRGRRARARGGGLAGGHGHGQVARWNVVTVGGGGGAHQQRPALTRSPSLEDEVGEPLVPLLALPRPGDRHRPREGGGQHAARGRGGGGLGVGGGRGQLRGEDAVLAEAGGGDTPNSKAVNGISR